MNPLAVGLSLILVFAPFQTPDSHSPTTVKSCTPGVSFWKLLDEVRVGYTDGRLALGRLYAVCLPAPGKQSTSNYPFDPDGGGKLATLVKTADGKVLNTYVWYAESIGGLWELSRYKVLGGYEAVNPLAAGNYVLEFTVEDKPFYRFRFQWRRSRVTILMQQRVTVTLSKAPGTSMATSIISATIRNPF